MEDGEESLAAGWMPHGHRSDFPGQSWKQRPDRRAVQKPSVTSGSTEVIIQQSSGVVATGCGIV